MFLIPAELYVYPQFFVRRNSQKRILVTTCAKGLGSLLPGDIVAPREGGRDRLPRRRHPLQQRPNQGSRGVRRQENHAPHHQHAELGISRKRKGATVGGGAGPLGAVFSIIIQHGGSGCV